MNLRELKKEVQDLPDIAENIKSFQENWVKLLSSTTNYHLPFLEELSPETRKKLKRSLNSLKEQLREVKAGGIVNEKLLCYSRYLIELKLTTLRDDHTKAQMITNRLLNDEVFSIKQTIKEIKFFEDSVKRLKWKYNKINRLLQDELSLDESLSFLDLPHKLYLQNLLKISRQQKRIIQQLGHHFIALAKETQKPLKCIISS